MAHYNRKRVPAIVIVICLALGTGGVVTRTMAQSSQVDLNMADSMRQTLDQQTGKRVKLKLISGQDLDGQVAKVGSHAILLTELSGMEFFDATVRLDQIAAVIVRRAAK